MWYNYDKQVGREIPAGMFVGRSIKIYSYFKGDVRDMHDSNESEMENKCKELLGAFQDILSWKWDNRFEAALAEFDTADQDKVHATLRQHFNMAWDNSTIHKAPRTVQKVNGYLGKLRSGQLLFTSDTDRAAYIYCAWWPWGNGQTISIRIAPCYKKLPDPDKAEKISQFRDWFGI
jgi:hypothetical protein